MQYDQQDQQVQQQTFVHEARRKLEQAKLQEQQRADRRQNTDMHYDLWCMDPVDTRTGNVQTIKHKADR